MFFLFSEKFCITLLLLLLFFLLTLYFRMSQQGLYSQSGFVMLWRVCVSQYWIQLSTPKHQDTIYSVETSKRCLACLLLPVKIFLTESKKLARTNAKLYMSCFYLLRSHLSRVNCPGRSAKWTVPSSSSESSRSSRSTYYILRQHQFLLLFCP